MKHLENINISLTLGRETREMEATVFVWGDGSAELIVGPVALVTSHGSKTHRGTIRLKAKDSGAYTAKDITDANYPGMRGNGHAVRSTFRHIGFLAD